MSEEAQVIREALINFDYRPRRPTDIYVTDVVVCPRRAFFNLRFNANPMVSNPKAVAGKAMHMLVQQALKSRYPNAVFEVSCQYPLDDGYVLVGRADMIDGDTVYEFKFSSRHNRAEPMYYAQLNCYLNMLNLNNGVLVIIDRNSFEVECLPLERDEQAFDMLVSEANEIVKLVELARKGEKVRPPHGPRWEWECKGCIYKIICPHFKEVKNGEPG